MLIPFKTFELIGGYDANLRDHEAQDLAYKLEDCSLKRRFDSAFVATHLDVDVRHTNRFLFALNTERKIIQKYGLPWS